MTSQELSTRKILFSAPLLPKAQASLNTDYGTETTAVLDTIDLNGNGQLDATLSSFPKFNGKGGGNAFGKWGLATTEPALAYPSLDQLKSCAQELGTEVLGKGDLPNGVFVAESIPTWADRSTGQGLTNIRPIETLIYQTSPTINPKANWAIDTVNNSFVVYEG